MTCNICDEPVSYGNRFARTSMIEGANDLLWFGRIFVCWDCNNTLQQLREKSQKPVKPWDRPGGGVQSYLQPSTELTKAVDDLEERMRSAFNLGHVFNL